MRAWVTGRVALLVGAAASSLGCLLAKPTSSSAPIAELAPAEHPHVSPAIPAATGFRLPDNVKPLSYDLALDLDPRHRGFTGRVRIRVSIAARTNHVVLHSRELAIASATIDGKRVHAVERVMREGEQADELVLVAPSELEAGEHLIDIRYRGDYGDLVGLYRGERDGKAWAVTQFEPDDARGAFPCFDEPRYTTPFRVLVGAPTGFTVASNAPLLRQHESDNGLLWEFSWTKPLPTYLIGVAVAEFEVVERRGAVPLRMLTLPGQSAKAAAALDAAASAIEGIASYTGAAFPYPKLDVVAAPALWPAAMENAGLVTFYEPRVLMGPDAAPFARARMEFVMAHELAHHWFGNLVTIAWWNDSWLKESFADWMALKVLRERQPEVPWGAITTQKFGLMSFDALGLLAPIRAPVTTPSAVKQGRYLREAKGVFVLDMLETELGAAAFQSATRDYLRRHSHSSAAADDFFAALSAAGGADATRVARSFVESTGVPLVAVDWACQGNTATVHLMQSNLPSRKDGSVIPVCLGYEGAEKPSCTLLDEPEEFVTLPRCPRWIEPNAGDVGYYLYTLPVPKLRALAQQGGLSEQERTALLGNSWVLAQRAGLLEPRDLLELFGEMDLRHETSPLVLRELLAVLNAVRNTFVSEATQAVFARHVAGLLMPLATELGEPSDAEPPSRRLARQIVTMALLDHADTVTGSAYAERQIASWVKSSGSLERDEAALALRIAARSGSTFNDEALRKRLSEAKTYDEGAPLVAALGASSDPKSLQTTFDHYLDEKIGSRYFGWLLWGAAHTLQSRRIVADWTRKNFEKLISVVPNDATLSEVVAFTCDAAALDEWTRLWNQHLRKDHDAFAAFEKAMVQARACADLRQRKSQGVSQWLQGQSTRQTPPQSGPSSPSP